MLLLRLVFGLLMVAGVVCFAMYVATGAPRWLQWGFLVIKWTLIAALGFFAVLILERLALLL